MAERTPAEPNETSRRRRLGYARWAAALASSLVVAAAVGTTTHAAFYATTDNGANNASTGTVDLIDDDANSVVINMNNMKPTDSSGYKCVNVTYQGSLTSNIHLYSTAATSTLAAYLTVTIDVAPFSATGGATLSCTGYNTGSSTNLYNGTLATLLSTNSNFSNGLTGWDGATNGAKKSYRFNITLQDNNNAQNKSANPMFTWEAQNT